MALASSALGTCRQSRSTFQSLWQPGCGAGELPFWFRRGDNGAAGCDDPYQVEWPSVTTSLRSGLQVTGQSPQRLSTWLSVVPILTILLRPKRIRFGILRAMHQRRLQQKATSPKSPTTTPAQIPLSTLVLSAFLPVAESACNSVTVQAGDGF